jgi:hypothetical protein
VVEILFDRAEADSAPLCIITGERTLIVQQTSRCSLVPLQSYLIAVGTLTQRGFNGVHRQHVAKNGQQNWVGLTVHGIPISSAMCVMCLSVAMA